MGKKWKNLQGEASQQKDLVAGWKYKEGTSKSVHWDRAGSHAHRTGPETSAADRQRGGSTGITTGPSQDRVWADLTPFGMETPS